MGGAPGPPNVDQISAEVSSHLLAQHETHMLIGNLQYTSTKTIFQFNIRSKVTLTVTFFSPVYPDDLAKQSQQFSYVSATAVSIDSSTHKVELYMDVSGGKKSHANPSMS